MPKATSKRVTISDIATMAGVSKATVSYYLNGKQQKMSEATRQKIAQAIDATGYKPSPLARGLNAKKTHLIGIIVGDITNTFSNQVLKGIKAVATEAGYHIVASESDFKPEVEKSYVDEFISLGVDGFIVQPSCDFKDIFPHIKQTGKPLVCFDRKLYDFSSNWIKTDNYNATYTAIKEAISKGYRRFIMIGADQEFLSTRAERSSGFTDALLSEGFNYIHHRIDPETFTVEDTRIFLNDYFAENPPSKDSPLLIFAPNCWNLPTIYEALTPYFDHMPYVGLLGFDNPEWASLANPSVSTINQPGYAQGEQAAQALLKQIEDPSAEIHQKLPCTITWRSSTL